MNVKEIIISHLRSIGADGLCNKKYGCWCAIDDFENCVEDFDTIQCCTPAKITESTQVDEYEEMK